MRSSLAVMALLLAGCFSGSDTEQRPEADCDGTCPPSPVDDGFTPALGPQPSWKWTTGGGNLPIGLAEAGFSSRGFGGVLVGGFVGPAGGSSAVVNVSSEWSEDATVALPPYPLPVHHAQVAYVGPTLHVFGGYIGGAPNPLALVGQSEAGWPVTAASFHLDGGVWSPSADLPVARAAGGAAVLDGQVYLVGGTTHFGHPAEVLRYDPATDSYDEVAPLPEPRDHLNVLEHAGRLYAIAGRDIVSDAIDDSETFEVYHPITNEWTTLPDCPLGRGGQAAGFLAGRLIVAGGERAEGAFTVYDAVHAYDFSNRTWTELPPMPEARHGGAFVPVYEGLMYIGGATADGTLASTSLLLTA